MSRRRVSCRELGRPDCDGWLWKKRRESGVFVTQKWQRFWFILKGPALYWYTSQQVRPHPRYGCHCLMTLRFKAFLVFQNFFFAADHALYVSHSCLSGPVDEMGQMLNNIKEGGVSLMGQEQPFTHDHFRRSFIKRCKNPVINEKVHTLRALHSTLKAKEAELLQINKLLDESDFSATKYRTWKQHNEELLQEIEKLASQRDSSTGPNKTTSSAEVIYLSTSLHPAPEAFPGQLEVPLAMSAQNETCRPNLGPGSFPGSLPSGTCLEKL
uniref:Connector enhancer of kinase suppressor of Ras 1 n=1 Tax=Periophthalmus magnuspinnatus TaxID=409849 RepID=A0A3B3ZLW6_9GOBI